VIDRLRAALEGDPRIAFAPLFGSRGRGEPHANSDVDVAVGLAEGTSLTARDVGDLASRLEAAAGRPVDLVFLDEAGPGLAYRAFRDGRPLCVRDPQRFAGRRARAILDYLDWRPIELQFANGALLAGHRG
jgi:predicted nucleotidyltransferase